MKVFLIWTIVLIYFCTTHKGFSIYKSCVWIFFQRMVIEILFNKKIKIFFFWNEFTFLHTCTHAHTHT
jgi:hypothetical protein